MREEEPRLPEHFVMLELPGGLEPGPADDATQLHSSAFFFAGWLFRGVDTPGVAFRIHLRIRSVRWA